MAIDTTTDPLRMDEAWSWFRQRVPIRKDAWLRLGEMARRRAFTVAGVASMDVLSFVWQEIDRAINEGASYGDFKKQVKDKLEGQWGGKIPGRVQTIFRTNVQAAYASGRYQQMTDPDVVETRPYWEFVAVLDDTTTPICRPLEGVVRHSTDPWWKNHYPPLHFNCRSSVMTLTEEQAAGRTSTPVHSTPPSHGFGHSPDLSEWTPQQHDYPPSLWHAFQSWTRGK